MTEQSIKIRLLFAFAFFMSCSSQTSIEPTVEKNDELNKVEIDFLTDLIQLDNQVHEFWAGYDCLREMPIYIQTELNKGILINPTPKMLEESQSIMFPLNNEYELYRNEFLLEESKKILEGDRWFNLSKYNDEDIFFYDILENSDYYENNFYFKYKNRNGYLLLSAFYHELFHVFQFLKNKDKFINPEGFYKPDSYPVTKETLPLLILLFEVMEEAYTVKSETEKTSILKYYVSINNELNQLDTTTNNWVRNSGFFMEKTEGSARYIEVFSTFGILGNNTLEDPTHGYAEFAKNISTLAEVRTVYAFRIFYHTGAGAIHLLKELGFPNLEESFLIPENTPYDLSSDFLNLSEEEKKSILEKAKENYNWNEKIEKSEYLLNL